MTADEIRGRLQEAVDVLASVDVPNDLRTIAFERVLDALGLSGQGTQVAASPLPVASSKSSNAPASAGDDASLLERAAKRLGLGDELIGLVFEENEAGVQLIIRRTMLPDPVRKAAAMRDIALLVIAGRQASGQEEWTPLAVVREECSELGVLDASNFAKEMGKIGWKYRGAGAAREARATRHHFEEAADLIRKVGDRE